MFENHTKSKYAQGYDPKFKEEATKLLVDTIEDAYLAGYKKNYIAKLLCEEMGLKCTYAQALCSKVWSMIMDKGEKRADGMKERNLQRLEFLYAESVKAGDVKNALSAIDQLNKLCQLYRTDINVSSEQFQFVIGETMD